MARKKNEKFVPPEIMDMKAVQAFVEHAREVSAGKILDRAETLYLTSSPA